MRFPTIAVLGTALACGGPGPARPVEFTVRLSPADGRSVGTALFQQNAGVLIRFRLSGLPPGPHGTHVHAVGRCDPPGFTTAGGHLNPDQKKHGRRSPDGWHLGDIANLMVGPDGTADTTVIIPNATLSPGPRSLLGPDGVTALVIHERADDDMSDPAGNAGARIACGVIRP